MAGAYLVGLLTAFAANSITHMGQPALLYIVPATLGAVLATSISRDEIYRIWQFTDAPSESTFSEMIQKHEDKEKLKKAEKEREARKN